MNEEKKTGFTQIQKFSDYFHIRTKKNRICPSLY